MTIKIVGIVFIGTLLTIFGISWKVAYEPFENNNKMGYKNIYGRIVIPSKYVLADSFGDGDFCKDLAVVGKIADNQSLQFGCIDRWGNERIPCQFENIGRQSEGLVAVVALDSTGKMVCGFNNYDNSMPIPLQFSGCDNFSEGLAPVKSLYAPWLWGYIKKDFMKTKIVFIPFQFENALPFKDGKAEVRIKDSQTGFVDLSGKISEIRTEE